MSVLARSGIGALAAASVLAGALFVSAASAQSSIKILVNDEPVTTYELKNRAQFLKLTTHGKAGEAQAQNELIEERLKLQEAKRRKVTVDQKEVDSAFAAIATRSKLSPAQLEAALRQAGVDASTLKARIRAELAWNEIVRARFRATVKVTDEDVAQALAVKGEAAADPAAQQTSSEYMLQQILFLVPAKAADAAANARKGDAEAFRSRFQSCDTSIEVAKSMRDVVVKPTVRREESQLSDDMQKRLATMSPGQTTPPDRVSDGLQVVAICAKNALTGQTKATDDTRAQLAADRGQMMSRRYLQDLRSDAVIEIR